MKEVILAFPDFNELFHVTTDASNVTMGALLSQGEIPHTDHIFFQQNVE